jgi:hypothetical protein
MYLLGENSLESAGQLTPRQHHPPPAALALQANIRTEPDNSPFIGTTRMWFTQAQAGVELQIREHKLSMK